MSDLVSKYPALASIPPEVQHHAAAIAGLTERRCGFVISTVIIVVCAIINVCINCMRWREDSEREKITPHQIFLRMVQRDPRGIRRQLARETRRQHPELDRQQVEESVEDSIRYAETMSPDEFNKLMLKGGQA